MFFLSFAKVCPWLPSSWDDAMCPQQPQGKLLRSVHPPPGEGLLAMTQQFSVSIMAQPDSTLAAFSHFAGCPVSVLGPALGLQAWQPGHAALHTLYVLVDLSFLCNHTVEEIPRQDSLEGCHRMSAATHLISGLESV